MDGPDAGSLHPLRGLRADHERLESAGYPDGVGLPRTLKANLAQQLHRDYFIDGSFDRDGEKLAVTASVYDTRRQKLLARSTFTGKVTFYNPASHYEIALVYADRGDDARALQHLRAAMQVLEDADPTCETARRVRAKLAEMEPT